MSKINQAFDEVVASLKSDPEVDAVSLIGSGALNYRNLDGLADIDLLILVNLDNHESREVKMIEGMEFDFTYLSTQTMLNALDKKSHIWLNLLSNAKHIYKRTEDIELMFKDANQTYSEGPVPLAQEQIDYIRFNLTKKLEDLDKRREKSVVFQYLSSTYLKNLTEAYFKLQDTWVPRDKKMMDVLFERDIVLYELVKATFIAVDTNEHFNLIKDILEYVLKPYGGVLTTLKRQNSKMEA